MNSNVELCFREHGFEFQKTEILLCDYIPSGYSYFVIKDGIMFLIYDNSRFSREEFEKEKYKNIPVTHDNTKPLWLLENGSQ